MAYRSKVSFKRAKKTFRRTANKTHRKNLSGPRAKRGGIRL